MILPVLPTSCADPAADSTVPAEFYWHCHVHAGTASVPSVGVPITATLAEWLRLPAPVHVPLIPQDVAAMASTELRVPLAHLHEAAHVLRVACSAHCVQ